MIELGDASAERPESSASSFITRLATSLRRGLDDAKRRYALRRELAACAETGELDEVLRELGMSETQLDHFIAGYPRSTRQRREMAERLGIKLDELAGTAIARRVEHNCALCGDLDECRDWLRSGAREGYEEFCPNAAIFDELRQKQS